MSIYIRACGHSDDTARFTRYPKRCPSCWHTLLEARKTSLEARKASLGCPVANAKANLRADLSKDVSKGQTEVSRPQIEEMEG